MLVPLILDLNSENHMGEACIWLILDILNFNTNPQVGHSKLSLKIHLLFYSFIPKFQPIILSFQTSPLLFHYSQTAPCSLSKN